MAVPDSLRRAIRQRQEKATPIQALSSRKSEWFPKQQAFYDETARLSAAVCGRRAGKTRGCNLALLYEAATIQDARCLYLNETRPECMKLGWYGLRGDGMYSLVHSLGLPAIPNASSLTIHFPKTNGWIYLLGADDEAGVRKALGLAYHTVHWDEAQKIPPKLEQTIREVLMPTLLDYGGRLRLTGTPVRNMSGLFYNVTRADERAIPGWAVHRWNLLDNPHFGRAVRGEIKSFTLNKRGETVAEFESLEEAEEAARELRFRDGILDLQSLFGGPEVAPLDSPLMRREAFGEWVHEDALYVYDVHKVPRSTLVYAPMRYQSLVLKVPRMGAESWDVEEMLFAKFPDINSSIADLPGHPKTDYFFGLAADIGYRDAFAWSLGAWSLQDPVLYEVASWRASELDGPTQAAILRHICDTVHVGVVTADAGGSVLPTVKGWSREWSDRYGVNIDEVEKTNKPGAIMAVNGDIVRGHLKFRDGSPALEQMGQLQWSQLKTGSGRLVEDPTIPNDAADSALYLHRRSHAFRASPPVPKPVPGTPEFIHMLEEEMLEDFEESHARHWR